ncbi:TPA: hypothetical protein N0F65_003295 [Lagenidium giganteum]|uniref:PA domain-containing protein n=1 Tax=Lagenidium giganteum TaxID=4803 RepID=A0AAV2YXG2_9STRA|nr:TPA: hypothetical protein N0F65_003295 [Lagenidium giganteum]
MPVAEAADTTQSLLTTVVTVQHADETMVGSSAFDNEWGAKLPRQRVAKSRGKRTFHQLLYVSAAHGLSDPSGCTPLETLQQLFPDVTRPILSDDFVLLVDRGNCSYTEKAWNAQQIGASTLIIVDTLEQLYNRTLSHDAMPELEYYCRNGEGRSAQQITGLDDPEWRQKANVSQCTTNPSCASNMCVPTGKGHQVCCAWDVPDVMGFGKTEHVKQADDITIPVIRLKISDGDALKRLLASEKEVKVSYYVRDPPIADPSQFIIWALAIITVLLGGYKGSAFEREQALLRAARTNPSVATEDPRLRRGTLGDGAENEEEDDELIEDNDTVDLTVYHAIGFLVFGSAFLLLLFYVDIVIVVIVLFALSAVTSTFSELWGPLFRRVKFLRGRMPFSICCATFKPEWLSLRDWSISDLLAALCSIGFSLWWFIMRHQNYAWLFQDVFGICLCVLFLKTIRLPNLRIATILLVLVFFYDIFMVFISPYIFHQSVMIKAATGGNQAGPTKGSGYCLRYPTDTTNKCVREEIPILLRVPKMLDWRDGQSMLGLGDIVLPGLLIVFCARYDYATRGQLMGRVKPNLAHMKSLHSGSIDLTVMEEAHQSESIAAAPVSTPARRGLFGIVMWGYAVGLLLANLGVMLMRQGQPALMYLAPCTLGIVAIIGWQRGILSQLWHGPPELERRRRRSESEIADEGAGATELSMEGATPMTTYSQSQPSPRSER